MLSGPATVARAVLPLPPSTGDSRNHADRADVSPKLVAEHDLQPNDHLRLPLLPGGVHILQSDAWAKKCQVGNEAVRDDSPMSGELWFYLVRLVIRSYDYNKRVEVLLPVNLCLVTLINFQNKMVVHWGKKRRECVPCLCLLWMLLQFNCCSFVLTRQRTAKSRCIIIWCTIARHQTDWPKWIIFTVKASLHVPLLKQLLHSLSLFTLSVCYVTRTSTWNYDSLDKLRCFTSCHLLVVDFLSPRFHVCILFTAGPVQPRSNHAHSARHAHHTARQAQFRGAVRHLVHPLRVDQSFRSSS